MTNPQDLLTGIQPMFFILDQMMMATEHQQAQALAHMFDTP
jgi:hypothetical protein